MPYYCIVNLKPIYILLILCLLQTRAQGQLIDLLTVGSDSTCVSDQSDRLLLRAFVMQKFNKYTLGQQNIADNITYRANNNYHLGLGFHYKWLGVNASFKLPYFNKAKYGETKFFDLQSYLYLSRFAVDVYLLSYKGYYLSNSHILQKPAQPGELHLREDLRTGNYGLNFQYIFNHQKFSYRAAFIQNACQVRSAGTWLAGFTLNYTRAKADSAIVPRNLVNSDFYAGQDFNKTSAVVLAFNGGYAYTQVIGKHFFFTGAVLAGMGFNYVALKTDATGRHDARLHLQVHAILRGALGYNTERDFIGLQYINYIHRNNMPVLDGWQQSQAGNIRLTYARRFQLKKKTTKTLQRIEDKILPDMMQEK